MTSVSGARKTSNKSHGKPESRSSLSAAGEGTSRRGDRDGGAYELSPDDLKSTSAKRRLPEPLDVDTKDGFGP